MSAGGIGAAVQIGVEIAQVVGPLIPELVKWIGSLVAGGKSPSEAGEIVRRDIQERQRAYEAARDADVAALDAKYAQQPPANPFGDGDDSKS